MAIKVCQIFWRFWLENNSPKMLKHCQNGDKYCSSKIPEQWKFSKIISTFKNGNKVEIESYRPIANLCSTSNFFEKLILKQINYLESKNKLDLTGKYQHGFKKSKSTATAGALLQSIISCAADNMCLLYSVCHQFFQYFIR